MISDVLLRHQTDKKWDTMIRNIIPFFVLFFFNQQQQQNEDKGYGNDLNQQ